MDHLLSKEKENKKPTRLFLFDSERTTKFFQEIVL